MSTGPVLERDDPAGPDGTPPAGAATSADAYLESLRQAARAIARGQSGDAQAKRDPSLPEFGPDYIGSVIAGAVLAELGRTSLTDTEWSTLKPALAGLIAKALDWDGGDRVRATALTAAKHGLGIRLANSDEAGGDLLDEMAVDVEQLSAATRDVRRPTAVQLVARGRVLGLAYLTGLEPRAGRSAVEAILDQAGDLSPQVAARAFSGDPAFWSAVAQTGLRQFLAHPTLDVRTLARTHARQALGSGMRSRLFGANGVADTEETLRRRRSRGTSVRAIPILMYHRVADEGDDGLARFRVPTKAFQLQMEWLQQHAFTPLSMQDLHRARRGEQELPPRPVVITFDDGFLDFYDHAWPVLRRLNFASVMFVIAGKVGQSSDWDNHLGRSEPLMTWPQLAEIAAGGVSIGSHSMTHPRFSRLAMDQAHAQMSECAALIKQNLGNRPMAFCYPYGVYDRLIERILPTCDYEFGFTCDAGAATLDGNPLRLPRIEVAGWDDAASFGAKLQPYAVS